MAHSGSTIMPQLAGYGLQEWKDWDEIEVMQISPSRNGFGITPYTQCSPVGARKRGRSRSPARFEHDAKRVKDGNATSPRPQAAHPRGQHFIDAKGPSARMQLKQDVPSACSSRPPSASTRRSFGPFEVEDDSDEEIVVARPRSPSGLRIQRRKSVQDAALRAYQKKESELWRLKALEKRSRTTHSAFGSTNATQRHGVLDQPILISDDDEVVSLDGVEANKDSVAETYCDAVVFCHSQPTTQPSQSSENSMGTAPPAHVAKAVSPQTVLSPDPADFADHTASSGPPDTIDSPVRSMPKPAEPGTQHRKSRVDPTVERLRAQFRLDELREAQEKSRQEELRQEEAAEAKQKAEEESRVTQQQAERAAEQKKDAKLQRQEEQRQEVLRNPGLNAGVTPQGLSKVQHGQKHRNASDVDEAEGLSRPIEPEAQNQTPYPAEALDALEEQRHSNLAARASESDGELAARGNKPLFNACQCDPPSIEDRVDSVPSEEVDSTAEIPSRDADGVSLESTVNRDAETQRQQRIEVKRARNARNRQATGAEDDLVLEEPESTDNKRQTQSLTPSTSLSGNGPTRDEKPTFTKPFSLNSATGQAALGRMITGAGPRTPAGTFVSPESGKAKPNVRLQGELGPEDVQLVRWRREGAIWSNVIERCERAFGIKRSEDALRKRFRQVEAAVDALDEATSDRALDGNAEALHQLNSFATTTKGTSKTGEVTAADVTMLRWRDHGMSFDDIISRSHELYGLRRSSSAVRNRYNALKTIMNAIEPSAALLDSAEAGDIGALRELNTLAQGHWPVHLPSKCWTRKITSNQALTVRHQPCGPMAETVNGPTGALEDRAHREAPGREADGSSLLSARSSDTDHRSDGLRQTTGGKTLSIETMSYYLTAIHETLLEEQEEQTRGATFQTELTEEDFHHFYYVVQRREVSGPELGDDVDIEEKPFVDCDGAEFTSISEANAAVTFHGVPPNDENLARAIVQAEYRNMCWTKTGDGLQCLTVDCGDCGMVQARVEQRQRQARERRLPEITDHLAPRTIFRVATRTVTKARQSDTERIDDLFGDMPEDFDERVHKEYINDASYTTLNQATDIAIDHVVERTFKSNSPNLRQREEERRAIKEELRQQQLHQGEGALFSHALQVGEDVGVVVLVEKGRLVGARNF